jgi:hypothetical protein
MNLLRLASLALLGTIALLGSAGACGGGVQGAGGSGAGGSGGGGSGGGAAFDACTGPKQCVLTNATCCGVCGMPEVTDMVAVNQAKLDAFRGDLCPQPVGCPECAQEPNPNLFAYCEEGRCVAADARTHAVSACTDTSDCVLRYGMGCCESTCQGVESELTSVSVQGFQSIHDALGY